MNSSLTASFFISLRDTGSSLIVLFSVFSTSFSDLRAAITVPSKVSVDLGMSLRARSYSWIGIESENYSLKGWFPIKAVCWLYMLEVLFWNQK